MTKAKITEQINNTYIGKQYTEHRLRKTPCGCWHCGWANIHAKASVSSQHTFFFSGSSIQNNPTSQDSAFKTVSAPLRRVGKPSLNLKEHNLSHPSVKPSTYVFYPSLSINIKLWQTDNLSSFF